MELERSELAPRRAMRKDLDAAMRHLLAEYSSGIKGEIKATIGELNNDFKE